MIQPIPFENAAALAVFRDLDPEDRCEAMLMRGGSCDHLDLWADWRQAQPYCPLSLVLTSAAGTPFAVLAVARVPGCVGLAQAALLARSHKRWRRQLAQAAVLIRSALGGWADEQAITRIEARSWAGHPTASRFLTGCGFLQEATLSGFGPDGRAVFHQFSWTTSRKEKSNVQYAEN
ncbi:hypothetical protein CDO87_03455 [Sagittula sp. P11]|uniref:hypothetical protein n=1 Tax=Sagittula sp. P11 TaxID=2009329 RepID=UPI000C2D02A1|nr:hypothetical protein [Sagittula sp. P11]AUC52302.1 hypothetical protein CDO87_03455 [Sagittula sp. P11]